MIDCPSCHTLNPDSERGCLACGAALADARPTAGGGLARCPAGHPIDPAWATCPYCDRAARSAPAAVPATRFDGGVTKSLSPPPPWPAPPSSGRAVPPLPAPATRLEEAAAPARARRTLLQETPVPGPAAGEGKAPGALSPLVAVLAAPGMGPGGAIFAIRAGKTLIGSERRSDVAIAGDSRVSSEHAVILFREGTFYLSDRLSTNGTFVNGLEVPANGTIVLRDRDRLLIGDTRLTLLIVDTAHPTAAGS